MESRAWGADVGGGARGGGEIDRSSSGKPSVAILRIRYYRKNVKFTL